MNRILIISVIALIVGLTSCGNKEQDQMVQRIDSTLTKLKSAEVQLLSIDTAASNKMIAFNDRSLKYIQDNFGDKASKEEGFFISDIIAVRRSFNKLNKQYVGLVDDMLYAKTQLLDLKKDVEKGLVPQNEFNTYIETENKAVDMFVNSVKGLEAWQENNATRFNRMKPQVEEFVAKIEQNTSQSVE